MPSHLSLVPSLAAGAGLGLALLALTGCGEPPVRADQTPRETVRAPAPAGRAAGDIVSLSEAEGQILAEVAFGSADGVEPGSLLRVFDAADSTRLKGMLQITRIIDERRCVARQVGLYDRRSPLRVNDRTRFTGVPTIVSAPTAAPPPAAAPAPAPVVALAPTAAPVPVTKPEPAPAASPVPPPPPALDEAVVEQFRVQMRAIEDFHDRQLRQLKTERDDALAALRSQGATGADAGAQLALTELKRQKEELAARVDALVKDLAEKDRQHAQELGAESARRQALQQRLAELERPAAPAPGGRNESTLERLTRLTDELTAERGRCARLETDLTAARTALAEARQANTTLERQLAELANQGPRQLTQELATTRQRLAEAEQQRATLELSRLEAERNLYDLAARVLRLAGSSPETVDLQARLRDVLVPQTSDERPPAKPKSAPRSAP